MSNQKKLFYLLSFIEGASVMAAELLGAKMLAPYFGSSLYVWASVLAITLGGLAAGYFAGGIISYKSTTSNTLFYVLLIAASFLMFMPFISHIILWLIGMHSLLPSVIMCSLCILFPPVFMMGMVSPLIIKNITESVSQSGKAAGTIYAISTAGGIISTLAFGFYVIPYFGLTIPAIVTGIALGVIPFVVLLTQKKLKTGAAFIIIIIAAFVTSSFTYKSSVKLVYQQETLLGQLLVLDYPNYSIDSTLNGYSRWLFVNRISQTMYNSSANENRNEDTYFPYVKHISKSLDFFPAGTNALILGLGGGSIANTLASKNFNVDVCELDKNIVEVAKKYFNLSPKVQVTVDDARHYIKICKKKYDVIIFDTFRGEDTPNHVFTTQSLQETKQLLIPNGLIIVNTMGYINGTIGKAMRSIYKTFLNSDFNVQVLATDKNEDNNNFLFYASTGAHNTDTNFIPASAIDTADAVLLKDEFPLLDVLNAQASKRWRILAIQGFANSYEKTLPVFK